MKKDSIFNAFVPEKIDFKDIEMIDDYDIELKVKLEAEHILKAKATKKQQQAQLGDMWDSKYYTVITFVNREGNDKFLTELKKLDPELEIVNDTYVDGYRFAKLLGIDIEMTASLPQPHYMKQLKLKTKNNKIK